MGSPLAAAVTGRVPLFNHCNDMTGFSLLPPSPTSESLSCRLHHIRVVNTNGLHNTKQSDGVDVMHIEDSACTVLPDECG